MTDKKKETGAISRREFLKDAGLLIGGTAIGSAVLLTACGGDGEETTKTVTSTKTVTAAGGTTTVTSTVPGGTATTTVTNTKTVTVTGTDGQPVAAMNQVTFTVNGEEQTLTVEPEETLRDVLRNQLGLTSIKDMCAQIGACGSCTIIMDGRPILSCMTLACECDGAVIETAEGIFKAKHPLIDTYVKHYCMQCGYCTPGFVCTSKALLDHNANPTEADIREALAGNLCRCATYIQHIPAVQEAATLLGGM